MESVFSISFPLFSPNLCLFCPIVSNLSLWSFCLCLWTWISSSSLILHTWSSKPGFPPSVLAPYVDILGTMGWLHHLASPRSALLPPLHASSYIFSPYLITNTYSPELTVLVALLWFLYNLQWPHSLCPHSFPQPVLLWCGKKDLSPFLPTKHFPGELYSWPLPFQVQFPSPITSLWSSCLLATCKCFLSKSLHTLACSLSLILCRNITGSDPYPTGLWVQVASSSTRDLIKFRHSETQ